MSISEAAQPADPHHQLAKALTWKDGFVIALANPGFLIGSLGYSIGVLGGWTALTLWGISMLLGLLQSYIYSEMAGMFPEKSGGIALYAHEGWRRYLSLIGPIATFGYWFAWSGVLAIFGLTIGALIQQQWFEGATWTISTGFTDVGLPHFIAAALIFAVWIFNIYGIQIAVKVAYVTGALLIIALGIFMFVPYLTGDWKADNMTWALGDSGSGLEVALVWLYIMGWSAYGTEAVATFAPEFKDTARDTSRALRSSALFSLAVYVLLPLGLGGVVTQEDALNNPVGIYVDAFDQILGGAGSAVMTVFLIAALLLSMNTATGDGGRALYGIARDRMTIKQLDYLNRYRVPARGMTIDLFVNLILVFTLGNTLSILFAGNIGYFFATLAALSAFLLLRRDRPDAHRPIQLGRIWSPIAVVLLVVNGACLVAGVLNPDITGYGGLKEVLIGVAVLAVAVGLFIYRRVVQDGEPVRLREGVDEPDPVAVGAMSE